VNNEAIPFFFVRLQVFHTPHIPSISTVFSTELERGETDEGREGHFKPFGAQNGFTTDLSLETFQKSVKIETYILV